MKLTFNDKGAQERTQSNAVSRQRCVKAALDREFCYQLPYTTTRPCTTIHGEDLTLHRTEQANFTSSKSTSVHITSPTFLFPYKPQK